MDQRNVEIIQNNKLLYVICIIHNLRKLGYFVYLCTLCIFCAEQLQSTVSVNIAIQE